MDYIKKLLEVTAHSTLNGKKDSTAILSGTGVSPHLGKCSAPESLSQTESLEIYDSHTNVNENQFQSLHRH